MDERRFSSMMYFPVATATIVSILAPVKLVHLVPPRTTPLRPLSAELHSECCL